MKAMSMNNRHLQKGFGMVEVLVAMLVLAVGVLGFAALQVRASTATGESYFRSQAMAIAQDVTERAQVNRGQLAAYLTASNWTTGAIPTTPATTCNNAVCTAAQMATYDISQIRYVANTQLPAGRVNMETCQGAVSTCVYVSWADTLPTAGNTAQNCVVTATGVYVAGANCVMLEMN